jgi:zinc protease
MKVMRHLAVLSLIVLAAFSLGARAEAQTATAVAASANDSLPFDPAVTVGVLPNGMRYYIRENHRPEKRAELRLVVNAGSVQEDEDQRGLAHMTEHMAFRGTKNFPKNALTSYLESIGMRFGADLNAFTSFDETVYLLTVPTDTATTLAKGFQILSDWASAVTLDSSQIALERPVVIEEWRLGQGADNRMQRVWFPVLFGGSRYASRLPIGQKSILESYQPATLRRFYADWYRPDLMAIVAVGDFDKNKIEALIRQTAGAIPGRTTERPKETFAVPASTTTTVAVATDSEATASIIRLYRKEPPSRTTTVASFRETLVERLFNNMLNERFSEVTRKPNPPFIVAFSGSDPLVRTADIYALTAVVKDNGLDAGTRALVTEGERVRRYGFLRSELDRAKKSLMSALEQSYAEREKTNSGVYADEYSRLFLTGEPSTSQAFDLETARKLLPTISISEFQALAARWLAPDKWVIVATAPTKAGVARPDSLALSNDIRTVVASNVDPYTETVAASALVASPPRGGRVVSQRTIPRVGVTEWKLSNGIRVLLKPTDFKADQILMSGYSPGGTSLLPDSIYYQATSAELVPIASGVGSFSATDLQKFLAGHIVSVAPNVGNLRETIAGSSSKADLPTMLQLAYLYFTQPRYDSAAVNTLLGRFKDYFRNIGASPDAAFNDTLQVTLAQHAFREKPISSEIIGLTDAMKSYRFYQDRYSNAGDFTFVFVGSFNPDSLKPLVAQWLGGLPNTGRKETWRDVESSPPKGVVTRTVFKGTEPQAKTAIVFTGPIVFNRANRFALQSLAELLNIKLRETLREQMSGTYGVSVSPVVQQQPHPGYQFTIGFGSAPERLDSLAAAVFVQIDSIKKYGVKPDYLAKVKESERRARETAIKQNEYWLGQIEYFDENNWQIATIPDATALIDALTAKTLQDAAIKYLRSDNYVRVNLFPENFKHAGN